MTTNQPLYSSIDCKTWARLLSKQVLAIKDKVPDEYMAGLECLNYCQTYIPSVDTINESLHDTGWKVKPVTEFLQPAQYFKLLESHTLPVILKLRPFDQIDYYKSKDPDFFHEVFGHCPWLFCSEYRKQIKNLAVNANKLKNNSFCFNLYNKLYWHVFEFGLLKINSELKAIGAGIIPSYTEISNIFHNNNIENEKLSIDILIDMDDVSLGIKNKYYFINSLSEIEQLVSEIKCISNEVTAV